MILHIKLTNIFYPGVVGGNLALTIKIGQSSTNLNVSLKTIGNNERKVTVYLKDVTGTGKLTLPISVTAEDNDDKFKERGTGSKNYVIDLSKRDVEMPESVSVPITEVRSADGKPKGKATLVFSFDAVVSDGDDSCKGTGKVTALPIVKMDLKPSEINPDFGAETVVFPNGKIPNSVIIKGCLYKAGLDWKVKPVSASAVIRWGINTPVFKETVLPGSSGATVNCINIDEVIASLKFRIADLDRLITAPENALATLYPGPGAYWSSSAILGAHEKFHIDDLSNAIVKTWKEIEKRINMEIVGSAKTLTRAQAETKMNNYLVNRQDDWFRLYVITDSSHKPGYRKEKTLSRALLLQAQKVKKICAGKSR